MEVNTSTSTADLDHDYGEGPSYSIEEKLAAAIQHIDELEVENKQLRSLRFNVQRFSADPDTLRFYTGFQSYNLLYATYKSLEPTANSMITWAQMQRGASAESMRNITKHERLCCIDQFFLFLCYCKCGLFEKDLSIRFNVSVPTVSRIIITWANYLYHILGSLPIWPTRAQVNEHMPECFTSMYPQTRVILDCTELRCQTPSSLYVNSQMYSHYKSHTTFKGLIGITPSGAVCFVSQLYSGSISDNAITAQSGIVEMLNENDDVMADKGFTISMLLSEKGATLNIPPFLSSKRSQFSKEEVEATQSIARVRIHVERAIRRVKEFHIFDSVLPLSLAGSVNQIWTVCTLLTNFRGPLF
ncbi:THAP2 [Branchiostoma lanceolatum]|nr:THAP2 [Branchiostoma lanceolatum]